MENKENKATLRRRMPAEWERQSCVQLTWPHGQTDWAPMLDDITAVYQEMAREIRRREPLVVVTPDARLCHFLEESGEKRVGENEESGLAPVSIVECPTNDTWARDHGFITVEEGERRLLIDFKFNGWGEKFAAELDNQINRHLFDAGLLTGSYEPHLDFVLEGGSIESDGRGTVFTTSCCLMAPHRNQPLSQQQIEDRLKLWLGAERVVWINHGRLLGDDTDGHIDTLVRVCPNDTLLYIGGDADHPDLYDMEEELKALQTMDGRAYRLLRLPMPRPVYEDGDRLPATYANYLVVNGAVLVPTYRQPDLDKEAMQTIAMAYPDREIVGIDCTAVIRQHGSLHCCTMQYY